MKKDFSLRKKAILALSIVTNLKNISLCTVPLDNICQIEKIFYGEKYISKLLSIPREKAAEIKKNMENLDIDAEIAKIDNAGIGCVTIDEAEYPSLLIEINHAPRILFYKGKLPAEDDICVAIVGSRKCSTYGQIMAKEIAHDLSSKNIAIVSGLALGIDAIAHEGALENSGYTVAVMGCGIDIVYPLRNRKLYDRIVETGCVISEYPPGTPPLPPLFPFRNRIISGLSKATIIIEAKEKSGTQITADFALSQGRDVGAVPGNVKSVYSKGCHQLIKNGAFLVESGEDVLEQLNIDFNRGDQAVNDSASLRVNPLLDLVTWDPIHVDEIIRDSNMNSNGVLSALLMLELSGHIIQSPGQKYQRVK